MKFALRPIAAVCLLLIFVAPPARGQQDDFALSLGMKHGVFYPALSWVPVRIDVRNNSARPLTGYVDMPIQGEDMAVTIRVPVHVAANSRTTQTGFAYFPEEVLMTAQQKKDRSVPPVTFAELHRADGSVASGGRVQLLARPITPPDNANLAVIRPPATTILLADDFDDAPAFDADEFLRTIQKVGGYASSLGTLGSDEFPRHRAAFDGVGVVLFGKTDPDSLDPAQQQVLLDFVRAGGVLVVSNPDPEVVGASWLAEHLPVQLIGRRLNHQITHDGRALAFIGNVPMTEALPGGGQTIAADEHYVHAAVQTLGLGRIVFTSFPVNALKHDDGAADALWAQLLATDAPPRDWAATRLPEVRDGVLSRMIGKSVPPWGLAAGVTGGYLLLVVGAQLAIGGARRPKAFAVTLAIAGLISLGLVASGFVRAREQHPMAARIATLDLSTGGGGLIQQSVAYVGRGDDSFSIKAVGDDVTIRVAQTYSRNDKPVLAQQPFGVPEAAMFKESYQRVWHADGSLPATMKLSAVARFDEDGLKLRASNQLGAPLEAPRVVWDGAVLPLGESLPVGDTTRATSVAEGSMLVSGEDKLRQDLLAASLQGSNVITQRPAVPPMLVAFVGESAVPRLLETSVGDELVLKTQALARVPLTIEPTPVGQAVRVPDRLVRMVTDRRSLGLPYDHGKGEWLSTQQDGEFVIGFAAPWQIGVLKPTRATVTANLNAPRHRITLRPRTAAEGGVTWDNPVTTQTATFDLKPGDSDENGVVWFTMQVQRGGELALGEVPSPWHLRSLRMGLEGAVAAAPRRPAPSSLAAAGEPDEDEAPEPAAKKPAPRKPENAGKPEPKKPDDARKNNQKPEAKKPAEKK